MRNKDHQFSGLLQMRTKTILSKIILPDRTTQVKQIRVYTRSIILRDLDTPLSPKQFSKKYKIKQSLVSQTMYNLYNEGLLDRNICACGKGFVYQLKKQ